MHAKVCLRIKMSIGKHTRFTPPMKSLSFVVMEKSHYSFLVESVSLFTNEWAFHFVDRLLEELFVLTNKQFLDALQATFALSNGVNLDALYQNLNQRSWLREFSPGQWQTIKRDWEGRLRCTSNHELENRDSKRVNVFQHYDFSLFAVRYLFLLFWKRPVTSFGA